MTLLRDYDREMLKILLLLFQCREAFSASKTHFWGSLEWAVESTTVTHSSVDLWGILLPLTSTPDRRDRRLLVSPPKDTDKAGKRNCQSSEAKSFPQPVGFEPGRYPVYRPVARAGQATALTHSATAPPSIS